MSNNAFVTLVAVSLLLTCGCSEQTGREHVVSVSNPGTSAVRQAAVVLSLHELGLSDPEKSHVVVVRADNDEEVPSQVDRFDGDGLSDELFFLLDLPAESSVDVRIVPTAEAPEYTRRTQALVAVRQGGMFDETGMYVNGTEFTPVSRVEVPTEQEQDSDWALFEGPVWESDLVGYRYYLDDRFRTDVFGKSVREPVLHRVEGDYHAVSEWGADVLKVGESLGLGSPAVMTEDGPRVVDNAQRRIVEVVASGALRSILRTTQLGWSVLDTTADFVSELEIHAGHRWTEQRIRIDGLPEPTRLTTGIVRHPGAETLYSGEEAGMLFAYTWGVQSDQGHLLGMAVLVPLDLEPAVHGSDPLTHLVTFETTDGRAAYRYLAAWELEPDPITTREDFEMEVRRLASEWSSETTVSIR
jgi:hypothetical protein